MTTYAIAISLGPVGGFISSGRRSRDLWYGSRMLWWRVLKVGEFLQKQCDARNFQLEWVVPTRQRLEQRIPPHVPPQDGATGSNKLHFFLEGADEDHLKQLLHIVCTSMRDWLATDVQTMCSQSDVKAMGIDVQAICKQSDAIRKGDFLEFYAARRLEWDTR